MNKYEYNEKYNKTTSRKINRQLSNNDTINKNTSIVVKIKLQGQLSFRNIERKLPMQWCFEVNFAFQAKKKKLKLKTVLVFLKYKHNIIQS